MWNFKEFKLEEGLKIKYLKKFSFFVACFLLPYLPIPKEAYALFFFF